MTTTNNVKGKHPLAASIVHLFYPGFLNLPENTQYNIMDGDKMSLVHFIKSVRPLEIIDFNNKLSEEQRDDKTYATMRYPIYGINNNNVYASGKTSAGLSAPLIVIENALYGKVFGQKIYAELCIFVEIEDLDKATSILTHWNILTKFIETYKFLYLDDRITHPDFLFQELPNIRKCIINYSRDWQLKKLPARLTELSVNYRNLSIDTVYYKKYEEALHTINKSDEILMSQAKLFGKYLGTGFLISDTHKTLQRVIDQLIKVKDMRMAIVELFAIFEISFYRSFLKFSNLLSKQNIDDFNCRKKNETLKKLINKFVPIILSLFDVNQELFQKELNSAREIRNKVVHKMYQPTEDELNLVLRAVQQFINTVDIDESYKRSGQLKKTHRKRTS